MARGAKEFAATVGGDPEAGGDSEPVQFMLLGDGKLLWASKTLTAADPPQTVRADLTDITILELLVVTTGDGNLSDHADWADARITFSGPRAFAIDLPPAPETILTPTPGPAPRINGPAIFGVRPGSPFLYRIPVTAVRPLRFWADGLPTGLALDRDTGQITGVITKAGEYAAVFHAANDHGTARHAGNLPSWPAIASP